MRYSFLLIILGYFSLFWSFPSLRASPAPPKAAMGCGLRVPQLPGSLGRAGGAASPTHDVVVRGEVEGVLVPQQAVVGVVPVALAAVGAVVIVIQDLGRWEHGDREEEGVRMKTKGSLS